MASETSAVLEPHKKVNRAPLDDIMIAMDVVDTLRHNRELVERELNDKARRQDLINRLREIYRSQGIEVPDRILEEGVRALEEDRFTYKPPKRDDLSTRLAYIYVTRQRWGKWAMIAIAAIFALFVANYLVFERPQQLRIEAEQQALRTLPEEAAQLASVISTEAVEPAIGDRARALAESVRNSASLGDLDAARDAKAEIETILTRLRSAYEIRIVNRPGEVSGLWRIPDANPDTFNYYLVVEAIGQDGKVQPQTMLNEETGQRELVDAWAVRIDREVLVSVRADKEDDGIIQNNIVGRKERGHLEPDWTIPVRGGTITRW